MPGECWNTKEIESLIAQVVGNRKLTDLCIAGKSEAAVNNQRRRLKEAGRLNGVFPGRTLKPWTIIELNQLRNLTNEYGFSANFIAHLQLIPGRSKDSVSGMMHRNGLGHVAVREQAKQAHQLTEGEREQLTVFLRGEGRLIPSRSIAERWGIAQQTVNGYRRRLGIVLSWQQARSSPAYQDRREQLDRTFVRQMRERWRQWRAERHQTLENLRQEIELLPSPPARRTCQVCHNQWFAAIEFYYVQTRKRSNREKITMSRTCRLCRSEQRRHITPEN
jgi:DNA-binding CsgD family transcriptional regulator/DNA-directed RNA polymerase subunit M/transcription elongation factor TFIIS